MNVLQTYTDAETLPVDIGTQLNNPKFLFFISGGNTQQDGNTKEVFLKSKGLKMTITKVGFF